MKKYQLIFLVFFTLVRPTFSNDLNNKSVKPGVSTNLITPNASPSDGNMGIQTKNRIGVNLNLGIGFNEFPMFISTDGTESKLSFGGGVAFGFKYGHEIGKHFDLAADINYQHSFLRPDLDNAKAGFNRLSIAFTPSFAFSFGKKKPTRLRVGPGIDNYFESTLKIEGSDVPGGFNDKWKYKSTIGYHVNVILESSINQNLSFNYGLRWSTANFKFKSGGSHFPTDEKLISPDGSAIDLLFGLYYHF